MSLLSLLYLQQKAMHRFHRYVSRHEMQVNSAFSFCRVIGDECRSTGAECRRRQVSQVRNSHEMRLRLLRQTADGEMQSFKMKENDVPGNALFSCFLSSSCFSSLLLLLFIASMACISARGDICVSVSISSLLLLFFLFFSSLLLLLFRERFLFFFFLFF